MAEAAAAGASPAAAPAAAAIAPSMTDGQAPAAADESIAGEEAPALAEAPAEAEAETDADAEAPAPAVSEAPAAETETAETETAESGPGAEDMMTDTAPEAAPEPAEPAATESAKEDTPAAAEVRAVPIRRSTGWWASGRADTQLACSWLVTLLCLGSACEPVDAQIGTPGAPISIAWPQAPLPKKSEQELEEEEFQKLVREPEARSCRERLSGAAVPSFEPSKLAKKQQSSSNGVARLLRR